jgi:hypothetical protein
MAERSLNSWKEIATYVGRGVRTVQRWERELGMPVRRPHRKHRTVVIGIPHELDAWLADAPCCLSRHEHHGQLKRRSQLLADTYSNIQEALNVIRLAVQDTGDTRASNSIHTAAAGIERALDRLFDPRSTKKETAKRQFRLAVAAGAKRSQVVEGVAVDNR